MAVFTNAFELILTIARLFVYSLFTDSSKRSAQRNSISPRWAVRVIFFAYMIRVHSQTSQEVFRNDRETTNPFGLTVHTIESSKHQS